MTTEPNPQRRLIHASRVAAHFRVSRQRICFMLKHGRMPVAPVATAGNRSLWDEEAVMSAAELWLAAKRSKLAAKTQESIS